MAGTKRQLYTAATAALSRVLFPDELSTQALETDPSVETVMPTTVVPNIPALLADSGEAGAGALKSWIPIVSPPPLPLSPFPLP